MMLIYNNNNNNKYIVSYHLMTGCMSGCILEI